MNKFGRKVKIEKWMKKIYIGEESQVGKLGWKILRWKIDGKIGVKSSKLENGWKTTGTGEKILVGKLVKKWLEITVVKGNWCEKF